MNTDSQFQVFEVKVQKHDEGFKLVVAVELTSDSLSPRRDGEDAFDGTVDRISTSVEDDDAFGSLLQWCLPVVLNLLGT